MALLSKESAIAGLLLLPFLAPRNRKRATFVMATAICVAYAGLRYGSHAVTQRNIQAEYFYDLDLRFALRRILEYVERSVVYSVLQIVNNNGLVHRWSMQIMRDAHPETDDVYLVGNSLLTTEDLHFLRLAVNLGLRRSVAIYVVEEPPTHVSGGTRIYGLDIEESDRPTLHRHTLPARADGI